MSINKSNKLRSKQTCHSKSDNDQSIHRYFMKNNEACIGVSEGQKIVDGCGASSELILSNFHLSESMKLIKRFFIMCLLVLLPLQVSFAQDLVLWLQNDEGIFEDSNGSVTLWENQVQSNGDATQSNSALGGEALQETYPGNVNVGFNRNGAFLALDDSSSYFSDSSFSVFYTGSVGDVGNIANLFGNMRPESSDFSIYSGLRFVRRSNGDLFLQYASPGFTQVFLKNLPEEEFFFFGFTMNASGDYKYFDNTADGVITGNIGGVIAHSQRDLNLNLHLTLNGTATFDHTEVAELMVYDD